MMSAKKLDNKGRFRCKTVSFRMSPEENELLDSFVKLSGYTKQDYLICRALQRDIIVNGNPRIHKALKNELAEVISELQRIKSGDTVDEELLSIIAQINITLFGFGK